MLLILDLNFSRPLATFFGVRANNDIFAEANVLFLITWNTFGVSIAFAKILNE